VHVVPAAEGGWNVTAFREGRLVVRHCGDWHRTERARRQLESELRRIVHHLATNTVLLVMLFGGPTGIALAQTPTAPATPEPVEDARPPSDNTGILAEPRMIARSLEVATRLFASTDGGEVKSGFYPEFSNMITGAGWISGGPGYRYWLFGDRVFVDGSAAISWRAYKMGQARIELGNLARSRVAVGSQVRWQDLTQVTYFGEGSESLEADRSEYRLQSTNVVGYATVRPVQRLSIVGRVGWLSRPSLSSPAGTFTRGNPATQEIFPEDPVFAASQQPSYAYRELWVTVDTRDHRGRPTRGGLYRAGWVGYSDQDAGPFSFSRSEVEGAHFVPLARSRVVLAMHGWFAASNTSEGKTVPFYLLPSLGGNNTLRAFSDFRFHDRHLLLANAEARVALFTHVDAAVFLDAGNVAPRVSDLNLDKTAVGIGLRMHVRQSTFARFDVAHGDEGWRFLFRMNDPLRLSRIVRRTAAVPFVP
jgi:hypothetical protein